MASRGSAASAGQLLAFGLARKFTSLQQRLCYLARIDLIAAVVDGCLYPLHQIFANVWSILDCLLDLGRQEGIRVYCNVV